MAKKQGIIVSENGPYIVSGLPLKKEAVSLDKNGEPLKWVQGENYSVKESYSLCRCGKSGNNPFCDGSHFTENFNGEETADNKKYKDAAENYEGPGVDLSDAKSFCAGAGFCHREGGTWELVEKSDNILCKKLAIEQACNCPSGRLVAHDKKTGKPIEPEFEKSVSIIEEDEGKSDGPIWVKGKVSIKSFSGREYEQRNRVTLCRCGKSNNKPFCDGSHLS